MHVGWRRLLPRHRVRALVVLVALVLWVVVPLPWKGPVLLLVTHDHGVDLIDVVGLAGALVAWRYWVR